MSEDGIDKNQQFVSFKSKFFLCTNHIKTAQVKGDTVGCRFGKLKRASCWTTCSAFIQNKPDIFLYLLLMSSLNPTWLHLDDKCVCSLRLLMRRSGTTFICHLYVCGVIWKHMTNQEHGKVTLQESFTNCNVTNMEGKTESMRGARTLQTQAVRTGLAWTLP